MSTIIALKSDYIYTANTVFHNLKDAKEIFELETTVISYAKCRLINSHYLEDFETDGHEVSVFDNNEGYDLYVDGYQIRLRVYEGQIISFVTSRYY